MDDFNENDVPAFLRGDHKEIDLNNLADAVDEDDDFPTLDEDEDEPVYTEEAKADDDYQAGKEADADAAENPRGKPGSNSGVNADQLRSFIERIERLDEEKKTLSDDRREVLAEAKGSGYDTKAIVAIVKLRKKDKAERDEEEAILDLYLWSLGMA